MELFLEDWLLTTIVGRMLPSVDAQKRRGSFKRIEKTVLSLCARCSLMFLARPRVVDSGRTLVCTSPADGWKWLETMGVLGRPGALICTTIGTARDPDYGTQGHREQIHTEPTSDKLAERGPWHSPPAGLPAAHPTPRRGS
ncbi:hypothetical protein NDU88_000605 [Pleurodeles waltl]|uniref:Uncharacterized protein n=1 Tax=Pleurodeles waltl TaxID=8319 RepID=A0AAV7U5W5_PLEWA|nr:hypothetical protein NDU88_000605 [Pleurodeles waltl]